MADRRRINGPPGGTRPVVYASLLESKTGAADRAQRLRKPAELRKICMDALTQKALMNGTVELTLL